MVELNVKTIGMLIIALALMQAWMGWIAKGEINVLKLAQLPQSCHIGDDPSTCPILKDNVDWYVAVVWIGSVALLIIGLYLMFSYIPDSVKKEQMRAAGEARKVVAKSRDDEKFEMLLKGLDEAERKILQAVKAHDGIGQNTLAIRTELSKAKVSLVVSDLEKRGLLRKMPDGRTNRIYLKQAL